MVGRIISLRPARHQWSSRVPARIGVSERVVEAVCVAVVVLGVGGCLQHGVGAQEALQAGSVGAAVHVDEGGLAAGAIALCVRCLRYAIAVCIGAPYTRVTYAHAPAMAGGWQLLWVICGAGGHGAKIQKNQCLAPCQRPAKRSTSSNSLCILSEGKRGTR